MRRSRRIAAIRHVRELQERVARGAVATSRQRHRGAETAVVAARDEVGRRGGSVATVMSATALGAEHDVVQAGLLVLGTRRTDADHAAHVVVERTDQWRDAARRVDALERLEARLVHGEQADAERTARAELDDLAAERHRRQA